MTLADLALPEAVAHKDMPEAVAHNYLSEAVELSEKLFERLQRIFGHFKPRLIFWFRRWRFGF
jgi:hypothetical protein